MSKQSARKLLCLSILALLAVGNACAQHPTLLKKWTYSTSQEIGGMDVGDISGDGKAKVVLGTVDNNFFLLDQYGNKLSGFYLGNSSTIGRVYSITSGDVKGAGGKEIVIGLGGAKVVNTYPLRGYDVTTGGGVINVDRTLYRTIRYYGGVYVVSPSGIGLWNYSEIESIRSVHITTFATSMNPAIVAGQGDHNILIYAERGAMSHDERFCTTTNYSNAIMGWSTRELCEDHQICCSGFVDCNCRWDAAQELCFGSYSQVVCGSQAVSEDAWVFNEYPNLNGTVLVLNAAGSINATYTFNAGTSDGNVRCVYSYDLSNDGIKNVIVGLSNNNLSVLKYNTTGALSPLWSYGAGSAVRVVTAGDINNDKYGEIIAGTNDGFVLALDHTGSLLWRNRVEDVVTSVSIADLEGDGFNDIIISSRDKNIYVFSSNGVLKWKYFVGLNLYALKVADFEDNGLLDLVVSSTNNVTRYELSEFYVKKNRADAFYNQAYTGYNSNDYTMAMIYVSKAIQLYTDINSADDLPKANLLLEKIRKGILLTKKAEADSNYETALKYYAINDFESAQTYVQRAKATYLELGDDKGVANADSLVIQIETDKRNKRKFEADSYYSRALTFDSFGNFTTALENVKEARRIYGEINYFEGTAKCDTLTIGIADKNYDRAVTALNAMNYNLSISYAMTAKEIYLGVGYFNGSAKSDELLARINESMRTQNRGLGGTDYTYYIVGVVILILIVFIAMQLKRGKAEPTASKAEREVSEVLGEESDMRRGLREEIRKELK